MPAPPARRRLHLPVPTLILTGALASGKTTFIGNLLQRKPPAEVWAVLINEFGAVGLDAALLEGGAAAAPAAAAPVAGSPAAAEPLPQGVHIKQLAGGCLCCALSSVTSLAIAQLLRNIKPDRLLIEPSGLAHPAALLDMLQGGHLGSSLALLPVVCLVDAAQFAGGSSEPAVCAGSQLLLDQIDVADVLVGSKADVCGSSALAAFQLWAGQLFPPKLLVTTAQHGAVEGPDAAQLAGLLACPAAAASAGGQGGSGQPEPGQGQQHLQAQKLAAQEWPRGSVAARSLWISSSTAGTGSSAGAGEAEAEAESAPRGRQPQRKQVQDASGTHAACGWIFSRDCIFSQQRLLALLCLLVPGTVRVKGVFRVAAGTWVAASAAPGAAAAAAPAAAGAEAGGAGTGRGGGSAVEWRETAYRRDSRIEVILDTVAAAAPAAAAAAAGVATWAGAAQAVAADGSGGAQEQQQMRLDAALRQAGAGDWAALEALLLATLEPAAL